MRGRRWRRTEDGTAVVEFAIVLPLLAVLLFGVIDFGITYNNYQALRQGVREAGRNAAVANFGSSTSCGLNFAGSGGSPPSPEIQKLMCLAKNDVGLGNSTAVKVMVINTSGAPWTDAGTWPHAVNGYAVAVCAEVPLSSSTGLFKTILNGKYMKSKSVFYIEAPASVTISDGSEGDPTGAAWNPWCTPTSSAP